jgi:hypothetical protein
VALYCGRPEDWLQALAEYSGYVHEPTLLTSASHALCLAVAGRVDEARALVGSWLDGEPERTDEDERFIDVLIVLLQTATILEHRAAVRALANRLACVAHLSIADWIYTCPARHLGAAAALVGDRAAARAYYHQALESAGKIKRCSERPLWSSLGGSTTRRSACTWIAS